MKILAVMEFPPAKTPQSHRKALRAAGVDYRIAAQTTYMTAEVDWLLELDYTEGLEEFAQEADILQFHPAIGQPWASVDLEPRVLDADELPFGPITRWPEGKPRVYYFHGSKNAEANVRFYAEHYGSKGPVWTSTLDYAELMGATYAPTTLDYSDLPRAALRGDRDPLIVTHAPTNPPNCHTAEFLDIARRAGCVYQFLYRVPNAEVLAAKARSNAGFDHLRGCFSVNSLENAGMGLAPLVGLPERRARELERLLGGRSPFYPIETVEDLAGAIRRLTADPGLTRELQERAYTWTREVMDPARLARRMVGMYEEVLQGQR